MAASFTDLLASAGQTLVRDNQGQLALQAPLPLAKLSDQAGLPIAPTTPTTALQLGANPDQAKMAGTPAQLTSAIQQAAKPSELLSQASVIGSGSAQTKALGQTSKAQQSEIDKIRNLDQSLSSAQQRTSDLIKAQIDNLTSTQVVPAVAAAVPTTLQPTSGGPVSIADIKPALTKLQSNPSDLQSLAQVNTLLGRPANQLLSSDELKQLYQDSVSAISQAGDAAVSKNLTVADLVNSGSSPYSIGDIAQLIGVTPDKIAGMSIADLRVQLATAQANEANQAARQAQLQTSTSVGQAEKGLAAQAGQELSAAGVSAAENQLGSLVQKIQNADTVTFNNNTYTVEDLLKSGTISGVIADYLNSGVGSQVRTQLDKYEPELSKFINDHEAALQQAADQMGAAEARLQSIQTSNANLGKFGSSQLDESVLKAINPNYGKISAEQTDLTSTPLLSALSKVPGATADKVITSLNSLVARYPDVAQEIATLDPQAVSNFVSNPELYTQAYQQAVQAANLQRSGLTPDQTVQLLTGRSDVTYNQIQSAVNENEFRKSVGLDYSTELDPRILDLAHDNQDLAAGLSNIQLGKTTATPILGSMSGNTSVNTPLTPGTKEYNIYTDLSKAVDSSGKVNSDNVISSVGSMTDDGLGQIISGGVKGLTQDAVKAAQTEMGYRVTDRTTKTVKPLIANLSYADIQGIDNWSIPQFDTAITNFSKYIGDAQAKIAQLKAMTDSGNPVDTSVITKAINLLQSTVDYNQRQYDLATNMKINKLTRPDQTNQQEDKKKDNSVKGQWDRLPTTVTNALSRANPFK